MEKCTISAHWEARSEFRTALTVGVKSSAFPTWLGTKPGTPFLWDGRDLEDLGTLGGSFSSANGLNDEGVVVGRENLPGDTRWDAFLWANGKIKDLGNLGCVSNAFAINSRRQVVGSSFLADCATIHAMLWQDGRMYDLNHLIPPGSGFELLVAPYINEIGVIAGYGIPPICNDPNGCVHAVLLLPMEGSPEPN